MDNNSPNERLVQVSSGDDDSDVDLVTDYLTSNVSTVTSTATNKDVVLNAAFNLSLKSNHKQFKSMPNNRNGQALDHNHHHSDNQHQQNYPSVGGVGLTTIESTTATTTAAPTTTTSTTTPTPILIPTANFANNNMVPIISVTPHSPGAKYNSILEDTMIQLQNIRESVVQMKNSTVQMQSYANTGLINSALSSSRLFSSCPSLPDLTAAANANYNMWSTQQYLMNTDRRKSWTAIEDLTECTKSSHKSVSLSSLDSEEQESIRAAERLHNRSSRNSTGGISTHSLNEAELARDFERIAAKRNLAPMVISRIPLQKSISTPSIAPLRIPGAKEENNITTSRHLSDSEDDNQDDRSLLCVRDKIDADHSEKRRKRGSIFFRKKKDKTKTKGQSTTCEACGAAINLSTVKNHAIECKAKIAKQQSSKSGSGKKSSANSHTSSHHDEGRDYYDGHSHNEHSNYSDETPLIRVEFLSEPPVGPHDLGADPVLGIGLDEHDSWSPSVPKEVLKSLKDKQIKRQEHIYEFIMTEKHHCRLLLVMQKLFVEGLQRHFSHLKLDRMFPRLSELTELHTIFLKKLRLKQRENYVVDSIADILLDFVSTSSQQLRSVYGEMSSNHRSASEAIKDAMARNPTFADWLKHCEGNPLLKKKGIIECMLFATHRLTKFPLLIEPLLKSSREDKVEQEKLQKALIIVKGILTDINRCVAEKEKIDRQLEIFKRIDAKSYAIYKGKQFKKADIGVGTNRKLKFEGYATLMQGRSKMQNVLVVVVSDCLFFLQENSHNKYTFFTPENKVGVVPLQKLLIREKAGAESRGIYIISSNQQFPEMYELKVPNAKDKNEWIQAIRAAVLECPSDDSVTDYLTAEEKQKLIDAKQANIRELIYKMRQKDIEQAILLEEKIQLQLNLLDRKSSNETSPSAEDFLANFGSYRDLITDDCDTVEIWKRVLNTVQDISQLASSLYTAATGLPLSRSFSSVGEKQSDAYSSPILPKRAETFGGFDERRTKQTNIPWRDAVLSTLPMAPMPTNKDNHYYQLNEKRDSNASQFDTNSNTLSVLQQSNLRMNSENISLKDHNFAALQVSHHLHTLLCIISQQMTTINNLRAQIAQLESPKTLYKHNDQLEELRNLQDKLQEEKQNWLKQKEHQEQELEEQRKAQEILQKQIKAEQDDIKHQREQLYRKMEILSSQGLLLSPNTPLPIPNVVPSNDDNHAHSADEHHYYSSDGTLNDRKKEKWRTASIPKTPPVNLLSATNAPKINQASIKQQIPMKLSSLTSTKSDKAPSSSNSNTSPINPSGGITQMFPLKLADKKNQTLTPNHSRTGSSPAIIQQPIQSQTGNPAMRTNTYPKLNERYRIRNSDVGISPTSTLTIGSVATGQHQHMQPHHLQQQQQLNAPILVSAHHTRSSPLFTAAAPVPVATAAKTLMSQKANTSNSNSSSPTTTPTSGHTAQSSSTTATASDSRKQQQTNPEEEEIYF